MIRLINNSHLNHIHQSTKICCWLGKDKEQKLIKLQWVWEDRWPFLQELKCWTYFNLSHCPSQYHRMLVCVSESSLEVITGREYPSVWCCSWCYSGSHPIQCFHYFTRGHQRDDCLNWFTLRKKNKCLVF